MTLLGGSGLGLGFRTAIDALCMTIDHLMEKQGPVADTRLMLWCFNPSVSLSIHVAHPMVIAFTFRNGRRNCKYMQVNPENETKQPTTAHIRVIAQSITINSHFGAGELHAGAFMSRPQRERDRAGLILLVIVNHHNHYQLGGREWLPLQPGGAVSDLSVAWQGQLWGRAIGC